MSFDPAVADLGRLRQAVEKAGYAVRAMPTAAPAATATAAAADEVDEREIARNREIADLKRKSLVSLVVGLAMMAADVPAARHRAWRRSRRSC